MKTIEQTSVKKLECPVPHGKRKGWLTTFKRIGIAGFLFFLIKGLVWVAIFLFGAEAIKNLL